MYFCACFCACRFTFTKLHAQFISGVIRECSGVTFFPWPLGNGPPHGPILCPPPRACPFSQHSSEGSDGVDDDCDSATEDDVDDDLHLCIGDGDFTASREAVAH